MHKPYRFIQLSKIFILSQIIVLLMGSTAGATGESLPPILSPSTGAVYYISPTGSDSNSGSEAAPWQTIQKALNTLNPGQKALVRAGTYTQDLVMTRAGTSANPITISAYPGETPILHAASTSGDTYPMQFGSGAAYVRLSGFILENAIGTSSANIYFYGNANHIEVSGNIIRNSQDQGIYTENTTSYIHIISNKIYNNGLNHQAGQHQSHGIYIEGSYDLIANNLIYDHPFGFGIQVYPQNTNTVIVNNTIANNAHSGIVLGTVSSIVIRNNIITNNSSWGIERAGTVSSSFLDHNLFYANSGGNQEGGSISGLDSSGGNLTVDPLYINYASRDLRLQNTSPGINAGLSAWSMSADYPGVTRPQESAPDIGAYEYAPASSGPSTPGGSAGSGSSASGSSPANTGTSGTAPSSTTNTPTSTTNKQSTTTERSPKADSAATPAIKNEESSKEISPQSKNISKNNVLKAISYSFFTAALITGLVGWLQPQLVNQIISKTKQLLSNTLLRNRLN